MTPVVNGLEAEFGEVVEFRALNAGFGEGQRAFNSYGLPGHPGYLILDPQGKELWKNFGPQSMENLVEAIEGAVAAVLESG